MCLVYLFFFFLFFFFNDTATTEIYTLSLHDALPTWPIARCGYMSPRIATACRSRIGRTAPPAKWRSDRKSTRLNSSHGYISYAVFCLKKKKKDNHIPYAGKQQKNKINK